MKEETREETFWNGEPCRARRVRVLVPKWVAGRHAPLAWWREVQETERAAVEVLYGSQRQLLDDEDGRGWAKVTEGRGSPLLGHRDLPFDSVEVAP